LLAHVAEADPGIGSGRTGDMPFIVAVQAEADLGDPRQLIALKAACVRGVLVKLGIDPCAIGIQTQPGSRSPCERSLKALRSCFAAVGVEADLVDDGEQLDVIPL